MRRDGAAGVPPMAPAYVSVMVDGKADGNRVARKHPDTPFVGPQRHRLQFANPEMPYQAFVILPYAVSILALVGLVGKPRPPGAVGLPYRR